MFRTQRLRIETNAIVFDSQYQESVIRRLQSNDHPSRPRVPLARAARIFLPHSRAYDISMARAPLSSACGKKDTFKNR